MTGPDGLRRRVWHRALLGLLIGALWPRRPRAQPAAAPAPAPPPTPQVAAPGGLLDGVAEVLRFGALGDGRKDCSAAFNAAFAALPPSGGVIDIPAGTFRLTQPVVWQNKALTVRGAGKGVTRLFVAHRGIGIDISVDQSWKKISLANFSMRADAPDGPTAAALRVVFPVAHGSDAESTLTMESIEALSSPDAMKAPFGRSFDRGFVLRWCWSARLRDLQFTGAAVVPGRAGTAAFDLGRCEDTWLDGCAAYWGDTMMLQTDYGEGIRMHHPTVVGANWLFRQDVASFTQEKISPFYLVGFYVDGGEVNTYHGGIEARRMQLGFVGATHFSYFPGGTPSPSYTVFDYTDCIDTTQTGIVALGHDALPGSIGIRLAVEALACIGNTWTCSHFERFGSAAVLRPGVSQNIINLCTCLNPAGLASDPRNALANVWRDESGNDGNHVSWLTQSGFTAHAGPRVVTAGGQGQALFAVDSVPDAVNHLAVTPVTRGNPPVLRFTGSDGTVNGTIETKGGNLYLTAHGDGRSGVLASFSNRPDSRNYLSVSNAAERDAVQVEAASSVEGATPNLIIGAGKGGFLMLANLPTERAGLPRGALWNDRGVLSVA
jgi:hypothetical protein